MGAYTMGSFSFADTRARVRFPSDMVKGESGPWVLAV
jgi:hypothetical protein